jgi:hypothetical protein
MALSVGSLQWEFITRKLFSGLSAAPLGIRYYPNYPAF